MWSLLTIATIVAVALLTRKRLRDKGYNATAIAPLALTAAITLYSAKYNHDADTRLWEATGIGGLATILGNAAYTTWAVITVKSLDTLHNRTTPWPAAVATLGIYSTLGWWATFGNQQHPPQWSYTAGILIYTAASIGIYTYLARTGIQLARRWNGPARRIGTSYLAAGTIGITLVSYDAIASATAIPELLRWKPETYILFYTVPLLLAWAAAHGHNQPSPPSNRRKLTFSLADGLGFDNDHRPPPTPRRSRVPHP